MSLPFVHVLQCDTPAALRAEMEEVGAAPERIEAMLQQGLFHVVKIHEVERAVAYFLKQELVAEGGEVILDDRLDFAEERRSDLLLLGTSYQLRHLTVRLRTQEHQLLDGLADELEAALSHCVASWPAPLTAGSTRFRWGERTYVMGIVNVTPDSFSGDGLSYDATAAVEQAVDFVEAGAHIIDVGGESTRPGAEPIPVAEEMRRVLPAVEGIVAAVDVPVSIDTYKARVAREALDAGAAIVNDVWAFRADPELAPLVAERGVPAILMHNRSRPKDAEISERLGGRYKGVKYEDVLGDVIRELQESMDIAAEAGVPQQQVIVDPGIGFGKTVEQNMRLLDRVGELKVLGRPILVGPSRKSFIGYTLDLPPDRRVEGTAATVAIAIARGADIIRVHDVLAMSRIARMTDAVVRHRVPSASK